MNPDTGGQYSDERQRQTAAEIARKKVLSAYSTSPVFARQVQAAQQLQAQQQTQQAQIQQQPVQQPTTPQPTQQMQPAEVQTYKAVSVNTTVSNQDLQKYHSAWQNYYQKYYNDYYAKAAKNYIETEKLRAERKRNDEKRLGEEELNPNSTNNEEIVRTLREKIQEKANSRFKLKKKHRKFIPIFAGVFTILFILFLQYNRFVFAPIMAYIAPGNVSDTGISAIDPTVNTNVSDTNKLIIPKLNVDVPVHFGISNDKTSVDNAMRNGVAHYMVPGASAYPGQIGNTVITGHSAGDIYSSNPYKFIFSGLERLTEGDLIYIDYNKVRYTYRMTGSRTVEPTNVAALKYTGAKPVLTLITCWPLGTERYRLLVEAEQINPAPETIDGPVASPDEPTTVEESEMPRNEKTLFENIWSWATGQ